MSDCYDSMQAHLEQGLDIAQAAVPMGMLLAWAVNLQLITPALAAEHERLVLRIRYGEVSGSQLLVAAGGDLQRHFFTQPAQHFLDRYYGEYLQEFARLFPMPPADDQTNYAKVAQWLTAHYMQREAKPGMLSRLRGWWRRSEEESN